jgi:putative addiction module component (TIGR02574 family)
MAASANTILNQALKLSSSERAKVVEILISSLDTPDSTIDSIWAKEADTRIEAFEKGEIESISAEKVFEKYRK